MAETRLTEREELFCQGIIGGLGTLEAYRRAYSENALESTAFPEASRILKREKVIKRLQELRRPLEEAITAENVTAREEQIKLIKTRMEICKSNGDESSLIRYIDMLNKIYGIYKDGTQEEKKESKLAKMDTKTLQKLTKALDGDTGTGTTRKAG